MMKVLLVTYNEMHDVPLGRYEKGRVIAYSGDYGRDKYMTLVPSPIDDQQRADAERTVRQLQTDIEADLSNIKEAYVYVGAAAMDGAMKLIRSLQLAGKKIYMIACDCMGEEKATFAVELGITEVMWCECGGRDTCARLVHMLSETAVTA
jgi:hypothetical protein